MKKLLVAAIGAAAAMGAFADYTSHPTRFEGMERADTSITALNTQAGGEYWSEHTDNTKSNNYSIVEREGVLPAERPLSGDSEAFEAAPTNALKVATQFGKQLEFKADATGSVAIPGNLYFDSLVKFTVCDEAPAEDVCTNAYKDAKIVMWLQCDEDAGTPKTNLWVRAGYLSYEDSQLKVVSRNYECDNEIDASFVDAWHRVTIKAIGDITTGSGVPGFAIYIDGQKSSTGNRKDVSCDDGKWADSFGSQYSLSESAQVLNGNGQLFPSLIQDTERPDNGTITAAGFDGTGWVNDLVFTTTAPFEAAKDAHTKKAEVNGTEFTDLSSAVNYVNGLVGAETIELKLFASLALDKPLVFTTAANVVLDFAGNVLTNTQAYAAITNSAANLVITNRSATVGGIWCDNANNSAFYAADGVTTIEAGFFHGKVEAVSTSNLAIVQGYFTQVTSQLEAYLPEGKELKDADEMPGFKKVVDKQIVTHTITFDPNGGTLTGAATQVINDGDSVEVPSDPTRDGYKFTYWAWEDQEFDFEVETPVTDITLVAQWEQDVVTWASLLGEAVDGAYEIDNLTELKAFQANVATNETSGNKSILTTTNLTFKLTADIELDAAWPGIGVQNGKDIYGTETFNGAAFCGTFDGQNHTISGFQMVGVARNPANNGEGLDYCGFFNSTYGATIQNLKIQYAGSLFAADTTASTKESGATFVGVAKNSTLCNLTTVAGTVSCSKGFGGIVGYLMGGSTVDSCTNNVNMTSLANNKCGGIAMITQNGSGNAIIRNCQNNGTQTTGSANSEYGAIVGYVGQNTTIADCETTVGRFLKHQGSTVTLQGVNKGDARVLAYDGIATPGLNFATVDGNVATFVADNALALNGSYTVMGSGATATFAFAEAGTIAFDTNLTQNVTFNITAPGLTLTDSTSGTVTTYTATSSSSWPQPSEDTPAAVDTALAADGFSTGTGVVTSKAEYSALIDYVTAKTSATSPEGLTDAQKANAVLCYALDAESIPTTEITKEDITIDALATGDNGAVDLTVAIDGVMVGSSVPAATLAKIVTAKGGTALNAMSTENVTVNGHVVQTGNVKITVTPKTDSPTSFFTTVIINK